MNKNKAVIVATFFGIAVLFGTTFFPNSANAQTRVSISKTYKVQVEYWFFDTDYSYWSTKFETTNQNDANFVFGILNAAKQNGTLNSVVPNSYWRYIAVDVRLVEELNIPLMLRNYVPLTPIARR